MADQTGTDQKEMFVKPMIMALKVIGLFFDVGTLMLRLLINTVVHDTPHGKLETVEARSRE